MKINERIKERRLELGLTLNDVAKALGVAESTVLRYESEEIKNMGIDKIENLARVLLCSLSYLMGWEEKKEQIDIEKLNKTNQAKMEEYYNLLLNSQGE